MFSRRVVMVVNVSYRVVIFGRVMVAGREMIMVSRGMMMVTRGVMFGRVVMEWCQGGGL